MTAPYVLVQVAGGWTFVGQCLDEGTSGDERVLLKNAAIIHDWGTDKGLGGLQARPTEKTQLHPIPILEGSDGIRIERRSVRCTFQLKPDHWAPALTWKGKEPINGHDRVTVKLFQVAGGWTFIGQFLEESYDRYLLSKPIIVHDWGQEKGLGQLVFGPSDKTVAHPVHLEHGDSFAVERRSVRVAVDLSAKGWERTLGLDLT